MKIMKIVNNALFATVLTVIAVGLYGCGKKGPEQYGRQLSGHNTTQLKSILNEPESFQDKEVAVEGKIVRECMSGCWFDVEAEGGWIHVDVDPSGFAIPQKVGSEVVVEGQITVQDGSAVLVGKGVEIK